MRGEPRGADEVGGLPPGIFARGGHKAVVFTLIGDRLPASSPARACGKS